MDASKVSAKSTSPAMVAALKRPDNTEQQMAQKRQAAEKAQQAQQAQRAQQAREVINNQGQRIGGRLNVSA